MQQQTNTKEELKGIQRYYTRTKQGQHGNNYYIEPSDSCPLDVLNQNNKFIILTFDKRDKYIVVDGKRYYLNKYNSLKCTDKRDCRVAIVDLDELEKGKGYEYKDDFKHQYTSIFASFDELRSLAKEQYAVNGSPYVRQIAVYDKDSNTCTYYYEPSCDKKLAIA